MPPKAPTSPPPQMPQMSQSPTGPTFEQTFEACMSQVEAAVASYNAVPQPLSSVYKEKLRTSIIDRGDTKRLGEERFDFAKLEDDLLDMRTRCIDKCIDQSDYDFMYNLFTSRVNRPETEPDSYEMVVEEVLKFVNATPGLKGALQELFAQDQESFNEEYSRIANLAEENRANNQDLMARLSAWTGQFNLLLNSHHNSRVASRRVIEAKDDRIRDLEDIIAREDRSAATEQTAEITELKRQNNNATEEIRELKRNKQVAWETVHRRNDENKKSSELLEDLREKVLKLQDQNAALKNDLKVQTRTADRYLDRNFDLRNELQGCADAMKAGEHVDSSLRVDHLQSIKDDVQITKQASSPYLTQAAHAFEQDSKKWADDVLYDDGNPDYADTAKTLYNMLKASRQHGANLVASISKFIDTYNINNAHAQTNLAELKADHKEKINELKQNHAAASLKQEQHHREKLQLIEDQKAKIEKRLEESRQEAESTKNQSSKNNQRVSEENNRLSVENKNNQIQLDQKDVLFKNLQQELHKSRKLLGEMTDEKDKASKSLQSTKEELDATQTRLQDRLASIQKLEGDVSEQQEELKKVEAEKRSFETKMLTERSTGSVELTGLQAERAAQQKRIEELIDERRTLTKAKDDLIQAEKQNAARIAVLEQNIGHNRATLDEQKLEIQQLRKSANDAQTVQNELFNCRFQLNHSKSEIDRKNSEIIQINQQHTSELVKTNKELVDCKEDRSKLHNSLSRWKQVVMSFVININQLDLIEDRMIDEVFDSYSAITRFSFDRHRVSSSWLQSLGSSSEATDSMIIALKMWIQSLSEPISYQDVLRLVHNLTSLSDRSQIDFIIALSKHTCLVLASSTAAWQTGNWMAFLRLVELICYCYRQADLNSLSGLAVQIGKMTLSVSDIIVRAQFDYVKQLLSITVKPMGLEISLRQIIDNDDQMRKASIGAFEFFPDGNTLVVFTSVSNAVHKVRIFDPTSYAFDLYEARDWSLKLNNFITPGKAHRMLFLTLNNAEVSNIEATFESAIRRFIRGNVEYVEMPLE